MTLNAINRYEDARASQAVQEPGRSGTGPGVLASGSSQGRVFIKRSSVTPQTSTLVTQSSQIDPPPATRRPECTGQVVACRHCPSHATPWVFLLSGHSATGASACFTDQVWRRRGGRNVSTDHWTSSGCREVSVAITNKRGKPLKIEQNHLTRNALLLSIASYRYARLRSHYNF
ncbi:hypothetical protein ElyMa_002918100 [Elysia marginata]|uniref:Uncharacterized protein n=1 Tax=Elysia marginata TaxID=1093978 RepID=A0AAV4I337_9GAST|nr:hypothetical protein ElyMa_002918100 [Elysia marginata]